MTSSSMLSDFYITFISLILHLINYSLFTQIQVTCPFPTLFLIDLPFFKQTNTMTTSVNSKVNYWGNNLNSLFLYRELQAINEC